MSWMLKKSNIAFGIWILGKFFKSTHQAGFQIKAQGLVLRFLSVLLGVWWSFDSTQTLMAVTMRLYLLQGQHFTQSDFYLSHLTVSLNSRTARSAQKTRAQQFTADHQPVYVNNAQVLNNHYCRRRGSALEGFQDKKAGKFQLKKSSCLQHFCFKTKHSSFPVRLPPVTQPLSWSW